MEHQDKELAWIILRSVTAQLTPEEQARLDQYLQASEANRQKYRELTDLSYMESGMKTYEQYHNARQAGLDRILGKIHTPVRRMPVHWLRAAVIILLLGGGVMWYLSRQQTPPQQVQLARVDIAPGSAGALLTLADGSQLTLDSMANGVIANQSGASVALHNGQLAYHANGKGNGGSLNTMSTPKGRQFSLVLPDGTKVWLNAASSLTYPTAFSDGQRRVKLAGEAYFEVAQNAQEPFVVDMDHGSTVEVLGTSFNINAYADEPDIKTTLLSGSVQTGGVILRPGQQAVQKQGEGVVLKEHADLDKVIAWRYGRFDFNDASLKEVMRQLERWYDITVVYEKGVPDTYFYGKVSKDLPLSGILKALEVTHVHFRLEENRTLVVMP